jgi:biotin carboxyl carrier protein
VAAAGAVPSPIAGQVFKIKVAVGQQVAADQEIIIIEAMKMETPVYAPSAGTIQQILVKEGEAVAEGQGMIVIG